VSVVTWAMIVDAPSIGIEAGSAVTVTSRLVGPVLESPQPAALATTAATTSLAILESLASRIGRLLKRAASECARRREHTNPGRPGSRTRFNNLNPDGTGERVPLD